MITRSLFERMGVTYDDFASGGKNGRAFSMLHKWSDEEQQMVAKWIDRMYADFKGKVADGRRLPVETVETLAQGKVFVGTAAVEAKLADEVGGLYQAINATRQLLGLPAEAPVKLQRWPGLIKSLVAATK